jgi:hypothetical protein
MATQQSIPQSLVSSKFPFIFLIYTQSPQAITQSELVLR